MFAILLTVFAPAMNHLPAAQAAELGVEICTSEGMTMVMVDDGHEHDGAAGATGRGSNGHCAYCGLHAGTHAVIPPSPLASALPPAAAGPMPRLFYQSPRLLFAWTVAASRAPPARA